MHGIVFAVLAVGINAIIAGSSAHMAISDSTSGKTLYVAPGGMLDIMAGHVLCTGRSLEELRLFSGYLVSEEPLSSQKTPVNTHQPVITRLFCRALEYIFPCHNNQLNVCAEESNSLYSFLGKGTAKERIDKLARILVMAAKAQRNGNAKESINTDDAHTAFLQFLATPSPYNYPVSSGAYLFTRETLISVFLCKYLKSYEEYRLLLDSVSAKAAKEGVTDEFFVTTAPNSPYTHKLLQHIFTNTPLFPHTFPMLKKQDYYSTVDNHECIHQTITNFDYVIDMDICGLSDNFYYALLVVTNILLYNKNSESYNTSAENLNLHPKIKEYYNKFGNAHFITKEAWKAWRTLIRNHFKIDEIEFAHEMRVRGAVFTNLATFISMLKQIFGLEERMNVTDPKELNAVVARDLSKIVKSQWAKHAVVLSNVGEMENLKDLSTYSIEIQTLYGYERAMALEFTSDSIKLGYKACMTRGETLPLSLINNEDLQIVKRNSIDWLLLQTYLAQHQQYLCKVRPFENILQFLAQGTVINMDANMRGETILALREKVQGEKTTYETLFKAVLDFYQKELAEITYNTHTQYVMPAYTTSEPLQL